MLHEVARRVDDSGHEDHLVGDLGPPVAEYGPFVLVPRVGVLEQDVAGAGRHQGGEHVIQRYVAHVRPLVVSPADVDPHPRRVGVAQRVVQDFDVGRRDLAELGVGKILEQHVAREPEVRAVELQVEARREDSVVLGLHRVGEGLEVGLARGVVGVRKELRDDAGRRRVQESALRAVRRHCVLHIGDVGPEVGVVLRRYRPGAARAGELRGAAFAREAFEIAREELQVPRNASLAVPGKAGVAVLDVGGVGNLGRLAVRDDVDAGFDLPANRLRALLRHAGGEIGRVVGLAPVAGEEKIERPPASRKRPDVGGCDASHEGLLLVRPAGNARRPAR